MSLRHRQRGVALIYVAAAIVALVAVVGLALDAGHLGLSKAQLQSGSDAAALAAAKVLDQTGSKALATAAANTAFTANTTGYREISNARAGSLSIAVTYSATIIPFSPGTEPAAYVRVATSAFNLLSGLTAAVGAAGLSTAATAVAGPSPTLSSACNIAPVVVCGNPAAGAPLWGYTAGQLQILKTASGNNNSDYGVGPGNFQLIRVGGNGANVVRDNMAGGYAACSDSGTSVETQPGNQVGPVAQGANTRFGQYSGSMSRADFPPDVVTDSPAPNLSYVCAPQGGACNIKQGARVVTTVAEIGYSYDGNYIPDIQAGNYDQQPAPNADNGAFLRRELTVPIGDCTTAVNGQGTIPVLGFACFFLLQPVVQQGNQAHMFGEFLTSCNSGGVPGPAPASGPGPYIIQLYDDSSSPDS